MGRVARAFTPSVPAVIVAGGDSITSVSPVAADLRGVAYHWNWVIAVGDAGTIVRAPRDGSGAWELVDAGVAQDLYAVASLGQFALALGDDVVIVHDRGADTWAPASPPPEGWGSLRASFRDGYDGTYWVVGLGGVAWSTKDLQGAWTRVDLGTDADLVATSSDMKVFGSGGTILYRSGGTWNALASDASVDFISAAANGLLLTADGRLVSADGTTGALERHVTLDAKMTAVAVRVDEDVGAADTPTLVVGADGRAVRLDFDACEVRL